MSLSRFLVLQKHTAFGFFLMAVFLPVFVVHVSRMASFRRSFVISLTFFLFFLTMLSEIRPMEAFVLSCALVTFFACKKLPYRGAQTSISFWYSGILCWILFNVLLATGVYIGGPMKTFRTSFFNHTHKTVALLLLPLLFYHGVSPWMVKPAKEKIMFAVCVLFACVFTFQSLHSQHPSRAFLKTSQKPTKPYERYNMKNPRTCGEPGCHSEIYKEWKISSHRLSSMNPIYKKTLSLFAKERGEKETVFCERCHNPDRFIFSEEVKDKKTLEFFTQNGISCLSCHLIKEGDMVKGDGKFVIQPEVSYLPELYPRTSSQWHILYTAIRQDLRPHRANYQRASLYKSSEFCNICHSLTIPAKHNKSKPVFLAGPYPSWKSSVYAKEGITCAHCHLQLFEFKDPESIEHSFHARPDHRMLGLNAFPENVFPEELLSNRDIQNLNKTTQKWISGKLRISLYEELFLRYTKDGRYSAYVKHFKELEALRMDILADKTRAFPGKRFCFSIVTTNETIGHDFPGGLLDMIQVWLEAVIKDARGKTLYKTGFAAKDGELPEGTHTLGAIIKNVLGKPISHHRVWEMAEVSDRRAIPPKGSIKDDYCFTLPQETVMPIKIQSRWFYRRCLPALCRWVFDGSHTLYPVTLLGKAEKTFSF